MRVTRSFKNNVDPRIAAVAIVLVLAAVQYAWWRGLVMRPHADNHPPQMSGGGSAGATAVLGRPDVTVETLAGAPDPGDTDGIGRDARFDGPSALALDARGNLYIADTRNNRIRVIAPDTHTTTLAGSAAGFRDGAARDAQFSAPSGVAVAPDGAVYVADTRNNRIRRIRDGQVTTVAGGAPGFADGQGAAARFDLPASLAMAAGGEPALLVADAGNRRVRRITLGAQPVVSTVATMPAAPLAVASSGSGGSPAVAVSGAGLLLPGSGAPRILAIADAQPDMGVVKTKLELHSPEALAPSKDGWFAADAGHAAVFLVRNGLAEVYAGACLPAHIVAGFRDGTGDKCAFSQIAAVVADSRGRVYVADTGNNAIRLLSQSDASASR